MPAALPYSSERGEQRVAIDVSPSKGGKKPAVTSSFSLLRKNKTAATMMTEQQKY